MDKWFDSKWFVRAVSLFFAILLYVFVNIEVTTSHIDSQFIPNNSEEIQMLNDVPVGVHMDGDRFVVSGVPEFVTISLEGVNSILTPTIRQRNFEVFVDLEDLGEGTHTVDIEHAKIPHELSVYIEPKTIEVEIEERASMEFPVSVDIINKDRLPKGYELGEPEVSPGKVTITSSKSVIDQIAIVKVYVDVEGLTASINNREIPVNVYDSQGNGLNVRIEPENVVISVDVTNPSKTTPVEISTTGELPEGLTLKSITAEVEEIEVFAMKSVLSKIETLTTEEIDLSEVTESGTLDVKLEIPKEASVFKDTIEVIIEIEQTKVIDDVSINIEHTEDQSVALLQPIDPVMSLTIVGNERVVRKFTTEDIQLFVDVTDLDIGRHHVPISVNELEDLAIRMEFEQVEVEIV